MGLTRPGAGLLWLDGEEFDAGRRGGWSEGVARLRESTGFSGDKLGMPGSFTGREFLEWTAGMGSVRPDHGWIRALEKELSMDDYADKSLAGYSSGMVQKLSIAASLVNKPSTVFWDEPTSNMDASGRKEVAGLVKHLSDEGTSFVIASHVPADFEAVTDWIGVMQSGRFVASGKMTDFAYQSNEFEAFTPEPYRLAARMADEGICSEAQITGDRVVFVSTPAGDKPLGSADSLAKVTGCKVLGLQKAPKSISEIYEESLGRNQA